MNVTQESNGELTAIIHITLEEKDYSEKVNIQLADYRKKANMPGFRPGKVPMGMIKKMYGKGVIAEEVNKTISEALNNFIVENKVNVLGYPLPNLEKTTTVDFDTQKEFDFYFDIGLAPEFELELDDTINVPWYDIKVGEKDIEKALNDVKVRFGTEDNPEVAEPTDGLQGVFSELDNENKLVEDGVTHNAFFRIEDVKSKAINKSLVGAKAEDSFDLNLMKAFEDEDKVASLLNLQEKPEDKLNANYKFVVEKVVRSKEAEIGEELFKKVYPNDEIADEEAFMAKLANDLKSHHDKESERQMLGDVMTELLAKANLNIPDDFMKRWLVESNEGKITAEQVEEQYDSYKKSISWQLIESKLGETFGDDLKVSDEEVRNKVREYFTGGAVSEEVNPQIEGIVDNILQNAEERQRLYAGILDEKYIKVFKEKLKFKNEEVDIEKFYEIASKAK